MVAGWRDQLVEKLSRPMATRVLRSLTAIVGEAQAGGFVAQNVCTGVRVRRAQREKSKVVIPAKAELRAIAEQAAKSDQPMALPLALTVMFAGLRASELRGLAWRNVDLKGAAVTIDQRADMRGTIGAPKSAAGYRTIPIPAAAVRALREWKLQCPKSEADLVFPSLGGKAMSNPYMSAKVLGPVQIAAKVCDLKPGVGDGPPTPYPRYGLHDFRHAAASLWIEQRVNPKRVQRWMRHSSIQITFDVYGHLFDQADQDAAVATAIESEIFGPIAG